MTTTATTRPSHDTAETTYYQAEESVTLTGRLRRRPVAVGAALLFIALVVVLLWSSRPSDYTPLSTDNSTPTGTRAVAQILRSQGVDVRQASSMADARVTDPDHTTVVVADASPLQSYQIDALMDYPGDLVFVAPSQQVIDVVAPGLTLEFSRDSSVTPAQCDHPDAMASVQVGVHGSGMTRGDNAGAGEWDAELCFPNTHGQYAYAAIDDGERRIVLIAAEEIVTNARLADDGNAALALRTLGRHPSLVWTMGDVFDPSTLTWTHPDGHVRGDRTAPPTEVQANPDFLPPGTGSALYVLAISVGLAAWWRARRFGRLVREPLPVIVRASEATRGRARLYRRARASGRATAALRGTAALRMARRLGVPRAAGRETLVPAVARAAGRPATDVERILYGPYPSNDTDMMRAIKELDTLESEVHQL